MFKKNLFELITFNIQQAAGYQLSLFTISDYNYTYLLSMLGKTESKEQFCGHLYIWANFFCMYLAQLKSKL